jgi:hypothetical protein
MSSKTSLIITLTFVLFILTAFTLVSVELYSNVTQTTGKGSTSIYSLKHPSPALSASKVVEIQLLSIRRNGIFEDGIRRAFRFTSMCVSKQEHAYKTFSQMIRSDQFKALSEFKYLRIEEPDFYRNKAFQMVTLTGADQSKTTYLFELTLHPSEPARGCWLVSNIRKIGDNQVYYVI